MKLKSFCAYIIVFAFCFSSAFAQSAKKFESYTVGETLVYEAKFSKAVFRGIAVADLNFSVERALNNQDFLIKAEAKSKGTIAKLFNYKFYQDIQSIVDDKNFSVIKTVKLHISKATRTTRRVRRASWLRASKPVRRIWLRGFTLCVVCRSPSAKHLRSASAIPVWFIKFRCALPPVKK